MGEDSSDGLGTCVAAGDITGDNKAEIFIGATKADGPGNARSSCGDVYVMFGADSYAAFLRVGCFPGSTDTRGVSGTAARRGLRQFRSTY